MSPPRAAWLAVATLFFVAGGLFGAWASRIPAFADRFELGPGALGLALLAGSAGAVIGFPAAGWACDRFGASRIARLAAIGALAALPTVAFMPNLVALVVALALFGLLFGALDVAMNVFGAEVERAGARPILSGLHGGFSLGGAFGAALGGLAAQRGWSVEAHFSAFAVAMALAAAAFARAPWVSATSSRSTGLARPDLGLWIVGLMAFFAALGEGAIADWSVLHLERSLAATPLVASLGFSAFSLAMFVMRIAGDPLRARWGPVRLARFGGGSALLGAVLLAFASAPGVAISGLALLGLGYATLVPLAFARAASDPRHSPGAALATLSTFVYGGLLAGPPALGFVAEAASLGFALSLLAPMALAFVLGASALAPPAR